MDIKRSLSVYLQAVYNSKKAKEPQIRLRVRWHGNVVQFNVGYSIAPEKWNKEQSRCKKNTFNEKGASAFEINKEISRLETLADEVFKEFEVSGEVPAADQYKRAFLVHTGRESGTSEDKKPITMYFLEFSKEQGLAKSWSDATYAKFRTLNKHLTTFKPDISLDDLNTETLHSFLEYLLNDCGMQNSSVMKTIKVLK